MMLCWLVAVTGEWSNERRGIDGAVPPRFPIISACLWIRSHPYEREEYLFCDHFSIIM
jgi:hypothetical protein